MKQFLLLLMIACLGFSCGDKYDRDEQHLEDIAKIEAYITEKGYTNVLRTDSGVFYRITAEGTGTNHPNANSNVTCDYVGKLLEDDNVVFDVGSGSNFNLNNVIQGWQDGIPKLKRGGKGTFFIPSTLAYGNQRQNSIIGKNTSLIFDVELIHFW